MNRESPGFRRGECQQELLDLDFVKGEKLTKAEEEQHRASLKAGISVDNNIVEYGTSGTYRRINDEDINAETLKEKFMFLTVKHLRTIKSCLLVLTVLALIGVGIGIIAALGGSTGI